MTSDTASGQQTGPRIRRAQQQSACAAPGCVALIWPGCAIIKRPGGGWKHADCSQPGKGRSHDRGQGRKP